MAQIEIHRKYRCLDDCEPSGCPGHTLTLKFQSVSNAYSFSLDGVTVYSPDRNELQAMVDILKELQHRHDVIVL